MNKKILPSELIDLLTASNGNTRKSNEAFVRGFFELIEEALIKDSFVKIKGFGTFKLINVSERESVKINTGERYQISGHAKITFIPDNGLKELVNRPFSHFETIILPDSTTNEELEAIDNECPSIISPETLTNEEGDVLNNDEAQLTNMPKDSINEETEPLKVQEEENSTCETISESVVENNTTLPAPTYEEEKETETNEEEEKEEKESEEIIVIKESINQKSCIDINPQEEQIIDEPSNNEIQNNSETENTETDNEEMKQSNSKIHKTLYILLTMLLMVISYIAGYYQVIPLQPNETLQEETIAKETTISVPTDTLLTDSIINEVTDTATIKLQLRQSFPDTLAVIRGLDSTSIEYLREGYKQVEVGSFYIIGTFKKHKLQAGETLLRLARQTYGHKDYVKYIISYNNFTDPNTISVDTEIALPLLVEKAL